jgi:hypothetical protein
VTTHEAPLHTPRCIVTTSAALLLSLMPVIAGAAQDAAAPLDPAGERAAQEHFASLGARLELDDDRRVTGVFFDGKPFRDDDLARLQALPRLRAVSLYETKVTDAGLAHLAALKGLRTLNLGFCVPHRQGT